MRKYYEAYDERYKTVHLKGVSWSSDKSTPVVLDIIQNTISVSKIVYLKLAVEKEGMPGLYWKKDITFWQLIFQRKQ